MDEIEDTPIDSEEIVEALEIIAKDDIDGLIQPAAVVDAARDPSSPLHSFFEWDESAAATAYRLVQARHLIARVTVRIIEERREPVFVNVHVRNADGEKRRGYVPTEQAVTDPDLYGQVIAEAHRGISAYRNRLSVFEQARAAVAKLDAALAAMQTTG